MSNQNHRIRIRAGKADSGGDSESSNDPRIAWEIHNGLSGSEEDQVQQWLTGVDYSDKNDFKISSGTSSTFNSLDNEECLVISKVTGDVRIPKNLIVDGDFVVEGKQTIANSSVSVMEDTNLQMGMLDTTFIRKGTSTTAVRSGANAAGNLTVYFGKEHYANDFISSQEAGPHYVYFQGFTNSTLAGSDDFNLNGNSFRLTSTDFFGYSGEGNQAVSNVYLKS